MFVSIFWMSQRRRAPLILVEVSWHRVQRCCFCHLPAETPSAPYFTSALSVIAISSLAQQQLFHTGRQGQWRHEVLEKESKSSTYLANCSKCLIGPKKKPWRNVYCINIFTWHSNLSATETLLWSFSSCCFLQIWPYIKVEEGVEEVLFTTQYFAQKSLNLVKTEIGLRI